MGDKFGLSPSDVVSMDEDKSIVGSTFKVKEMLLSLADRSINDDFITQWIGTGVECEVLISGQDWRKGKVRISLEFIPDQPLSPLDDLRE